MINCEVCKNEINCPCKREGNIKPKYRTCGCNNGFPQSFLSNDLHLVHLCSKTCETN